MRHLRFLLTFLLLTALSSTLSGISLVSSAFAAQTKAEKKEVSVWVNTKSGVYHCPGTRWYGTTKSGTYMTEGEARQNGYRAAYGKVCQPLGTATAPATPSQQERTTPTQTHTGNPDAKVWVNTGSGVYHCPGTRWYGNTKQGKYMSQGQAQDANYRPAYGKVCQ